MFGEWICALCLSVVEGLWLWTEDAVEEESLSETLLSTLSFGKISDGYYCGLLRDPDGATEWQLVSG